jgi:DNA-binding winged helix-turn-helix (wHTH) protein
MNTLCFVENCHNLVYGKISVNTNSFTVTYGENIVALHPKEYYLLLLFLTHPTLVFSHEVIIEQLWNIEKTPTYSSVRSHIRSLRKAFKKAGATDEIIVTIHGIGYRLKPLPKEEEEEDILLPPASVLKNFIQAKAIEYLVVDRDRTIEYISPGSWNYSDYPEKLHLGSHIGGAFPELIGYEDACEQILNRELSKFAIKGIARASNPNRPQYINLHVIGDNGDSKKKQDEQNLFIFFEDASEIMLCKQRLVQKENELYLFLEEYGGWEFLSAFNFTPLSY